MSEDFVLHAVLTWCISLVSIAKISQLVTSVINVTKFLTVGHILMIMKYVNMKRLCINNIYMQANLRVNSNMVFFFFKFLDFVHTPDLNLRVLPTGMNLSSEGLV